MTARGPAALRGLNGSLIDIEGCVKNGDPLLRWAQGVWFDLAEGSFPYPSSYIPFALLHKNVKLPPWPTQDACWKSSQLYKDWGVRFDGNKEDVNYTIDYGNSGIRRAPSISSVPPGETPWGHVTSTRRSFGPRGWRVEEVSGGMVGGTT